MDTPKTLTRDIAEALLLIETEHDRTSCSDDNATNGYGSSGENWPRCNRCLLLDVVRGEIPVGAEALLVDFQLQYKTPNANSASDDGIKHVD